MRSFRNLRHAVYVSLASSDSAQCRTLEAVGQNFRGRALGGYRREEDAVLAAVGTLAIVNGDAADAAGVHALAAPAALDRALLLESAAARRRCALVQRRRRPRGARGRALRDVAAVEHRGAAGARIKVLFESAPPLAGRAGAIVLVGKVADTDALLRKRPITFVQVRGVVDVGHRVERRRYWSLRRHG
jgi:hypothetical protein